MLCYKWAEKIWNFQVTLRSRYPYSPVYGDPLPLTGLLVIRTTGTECIVDVADLFSVLVSISIYQDTITSPYVLTQNPYVSSLDKRIDLSITDIGFQVYFNRLGFIYKSYIKWSINFLITAVCPITFRCCTIST